MAVTPLATSTMHGRRPTVGDGTATHYSQPMRGTGPPHGATRRPAGGAAPREGTRDPLVPAAVAVLLVVSLLAATTTAVAAAVA